MAKFRGFKGRKKVAGARNFRKEAMLKRQDDAKTAKYGAEPEQGFGPEPRKAKRKNKRKSRRSTRK